MGGDECSIAQLVDAMEKIKNDDANRYIRGADGTRGGWPLIFKQRYPDAPFEIIRQLVGVKNVLQEKYFDIYKRIGRHKAVIIASISDKAQRNSLLARGLKDAGGVLRPLEQVGERELRAHVRGLDRKRKTRRQRGGRGGPTIRWPHHLKSALEALLRHHDALRKAYEEDATGETWSDDDHPRPRLAKLRMWRDVLESVTNMLSNTVDTLEREASGEPGSPVLRAAGLRLGTDKGREQRDEAEPTASTPALLALLQFGQQYGQELTELRQRVMKEKTPPLTRKQRAQHEQLQKLFQDLWSALLLED